MKKFSKIVVMLMVLILCLAVTGCGKKDSKEKIKFGTNAEFPPFEYTAAKGLIDKYDGIDIAIAKQIGDDMDKETVIENMDSTHFSLHLRTDRLMP